LTALRLPAEPFARTARRLAGSVSHAGAQR